MANEEYDRYVTAEDEPRQSMREIQHTHPYTDETFGAVYRRGPMLADGGRTDAKRAGTPTSDSDADRQSMASIDHVGPSDERPNAVWNRGFEDDAVDRADREAVETERARD